MSTNELVTTGLRASERIWSSLWWIQSLYTRFSRTHVYTGLLGSTQIPVMRVRPLSPCLSVRLGVEKRTPSTKVVGGMGSGNLSGQGSVGGGTGKGATEVVCLGVPRLR